jgi:hypothetical protein
MTIIDQMSARDVMYEVNEYHRSSAPIVPLPHDNRNDTMIHRHRRQAAAQCEGTRRFNQLTTM